MLDINMSDMYSGDTPTPNIQFVNYLEIVQDTHINNLYF